MAQPIFPRLMPMVVGADTFTIDHLSPRNLTEWASFEACQHPFPWSEQNLRDSLSHHQCLGLWHDQQLVGYAVVSFVVGEAELLLLVLHSQWRGRGVASAFLRQLMIAAKTLAQSMFLEVRQSNGAALNLYDSCGFHQVGLRANYYPAPKGREDALIYAADLLHL